MKYYKFLVYFYLYFCALVALAFAVAFFEGDVVYADIYHPYLRKIDMVMGAFQILKVILYVVTAIRMRKFKWFSDKMLILIRAANFLIGTIYAYLLYRFTGDADVYDVVAVMLITGIPLYLNFVYFSNREELFTE